jgi:hypothetical protein
LELVDQTSASWNLMMGWLARLDAMKLALHANPT